jgi:hypothetical protein
MNLPLIIKRRICFIILCIKSCLHGGDDKKKGEVHPNRAVKAVSAKVVGDVGNDNEHDSGEAGCEQEAKQLSLKLDTDKDSANICQVGADGEASDGVGGQLQRTIVHNRRGYQPGHLFLVNYDMIFSNFM